MLIGVEKFQDADMQDRQLDTVMNDVDAMREILASQCDYPPDNIITITGDEATIEGIKTVFDSILPDKIHENDRLLVFYSGHGASREPTGKQLERGYIATYDTRRDGDNMNWQSMWQMDEFVPYVEKRIDARQMLFIIDCCFSGLVHAPSGYEKYRRNQCPDDMRKATKRKSVQIYAAGGKGEKILASSGTNPPISVFVESIKRVLSNVNPYSYPEGFLSAFKLELPVSIQIRKTSIDLDKVQHPTYYFFESDESGEFVFKQFSEDEIKNALTRPGAVLEPMERLIQDSEITKFFGRQNITAIERALENGFPDGYSLMQLRNTIHGIVNNTDELVSHVESMVKDEAFSKDDILEYVTISMLSMGLTGHSFDPRFVRLSSEAEVDY